MTRIIRRLLIAAWLWISFVHASAVTIPEYAYTGDMSISGPVIGDGVTAIGEGAFAGSGVQTAIIPAGVKNIGAYAFADCHKLVKAEIPEGVTVLHAGTFRGCTSLREVSLPSTLEKIESDVFAATALESIDLSRCTRLRAIGERSFAGCEALRSIKLPDNITRIENSAFFGCMALNEMDFPTSLLYIGDCALACTGNISMIHLPASLCRIGSNAMEGMMSLSGIDGSDLKRVPALGDNVWYGLPQHDIRLTVPAQLRDTFLSSPQWCEFNIIGNTGAIVSPTTTDSGIKSVMHYRVSEIDITVTIFNDGTRRVDKILRTK
jgi:surface antigen bspA